MKHFSAFILSFILTISFFPLKDFSSGELNVSAASCVLYCVNDGTVVYEKNARKHLPMASTTKIMTALITLEQNTPERVVAVSENAVKVEGTSMGLKPGDRVSFYSLCCGMLLSSGNDAANVAAESISGSVDSFASLMNKRAVEIGMTDTSFVTPSGLDDENHYSSALDMALLTEEAIKNKSFREICSSESISVSFGNPETKHTLYNHNKLLGFVEGVFGVKTGFTKKSGRCLASACERNGVTLICVTLNDPNDWADHKKLFDYGFEKCVLLDDDLTELAVRVTGGVEKYVDVEFSSAPTAFGVENDGVSRLILVENFAYAPIEKGETLGRAYYYGKGGELLCSFDLLSKDSVERKRVLKETTTEKKKTFFDFIKDLFGS
ncbi:MAG: D-alanyl-D-alanine carboxypeptidase [Ruminococcaceae bacterium]|jgi:D-alanyl-D-alanine carboxypeptidase/D-alanyl-D-alanine carboxypeptidase (penicillin-binding protein 5/6)|nr:D-alanyl-D-alanine carboxypeptidase [Oscillospiraceae bacterium]